MNFAKAFSATLALSLRELKRFSRQRSRIIGALLTPLLFWTLLGFGVDGASNGSSVGGAGNFKQFFVPGMMVMGVVFTAIYAAISLIEDRNSGFLQGVIVSPLPKWAMVLSKILGASLIALFQGFLLLPIAYLAGLSPGLVEFASCLLIFFVIALFVGSLALHFGWKIESVAGFHGIMNTVLMPMWFLSGATFPIKSGPLLWVSQLNPLSYAVKSFQDILFRSSFESFGQSILILVSVSAVLFMLSLLRRA
jgi:ABC-2 type transport system permease protein